MLVRIVETPNGEASTEIKELFIGITVSGNKNGNYINITKGEMFKYLPKKAIEYYKQKFDKNSSSAYVFIINLSACEIITE